MILKKAWLANIYSGKSSLLVGMAQESALKYFLGLNFKHFCQETYSLQNKEVYL